MKLNKMDKRVSPTMKNLNTPPPERVEMINPNIKKVFKGVRNGKSRSHR